MELKELVCVITGGGGYVGQALVEELVNQEATVVAVHHGEPTGGVASDTNHYLVRGDLLKRLSVDSIVENVVAKFGRIDVWVNTVGGFRGGEAVEAAAAEEWKQMMAINFITTLNSCQAVLPHMKERRSGCIINFGSYLGEKGMALASPYAVSKAAVHVLTKTIAEETQDLNIVARALLPTVIDTPANREAMPDDDQSQWLKPEDVAQAVTRLLQNGTVGTTGPEEVLIPLSVDILQEEAEAEADILSIFDEVAGAKEDHPAETLVDKVESPPAEPEPKQEEAPSDQTEVSQTADDTGITEGKSDLNEPGNTITPDSELATFSMVTHLKTRGLYRQALEVLDALTRRGEDLDRIHQERMEITEMMTPGEQPATPEGSEEAAPAHEEETTPEVSEDEEPTLESDVEETTPQQTAEETETVSPSPPDEQVEDLAAMPPDVVEDQGAGEPPSPSGKGGPLRTTTAFLIILLVAITGLGIQDWIAPEASLVTRLVQTLLGSVPLHSRSSTSTPPSLQSAAVTGFIDTLLDQSTEEPDQEEQPAATDTTATVSVEESPVEIDTTETIPVTDVPEDTVAVQQPVPPAQPETVAPVEEEVKVEVEVKKEVELEVEEETPVTEVSLPDPQGLFQEGQFHEAAQAWLKAKQAAPAAYTIVLEYVCLDQTIRNAYQAVEASPDLFLLPKRIQDRDCFVICIGEFPDEATAQARLAEIPSWFEENGAQPRVRPLTKLLP